MGMFDSLYINIDKLPISEEEKKMFSPNEEFQTKDFDCELKVYRITDDGFLEKEEYDQRYDPEAESVISKLSGTKGAIVFENQRTVRVDYTGDLHFYTYLGSYSKPVSPNWFIFDATFKEGVLKTIK